MKCLRLERPDARKIVLLSDTHGTLHEDLIAELPSADLILHAGDIGSIAVLEALKLHGEVLAVRGNNDRADTWQRAERGQLERLPEVIEVQLVNGRMAIVHGHQWPRATRRHAAMRAHWHDFDCVVYGHSHRSTIDKTTAPWVVNPGAAGCSRAYDGAGWMELKVDARFWHLEEFRIVRC